MIALPDMCGFMVICVIPCISVFTAYCALISLPGVGYLSQLLPAVPVLVFVARNSKLPASEETCSPIHKQNRTTVILLSLRPD